MTANLAKLGSLADFINGVAFKPEDWGKDGNRIIRIQNLTDSSKPYNRTTRKVPAQYHVEPGDLLVSWSASLGVFEWTGPDVAILNQHIFRVRPHESRVDKRYLKYGLKLALDKMQRHLHGATMQHVNRGEFLSTQIFVPPLPEQRRIAEILDRADALRAKRRAALAHLDTLTQSIFLDMFGDPIAGESRYPILALSAVVARPFQSGAYFPKDAYCIEEGVEMVHMGDAFYHTVVRGSLKRVACDDTAIDKYSISDSDILVARRSLNYEGSAKPCLIPKSIEPLIYESSLIRVTPRLDMVTVPYLFHYLNNDRVRRRFVYPFVTQSTISGINLSNLARVPVVVPPVSLQNEFALRIDAVENLKAAHRISLGQQNSLLASLQHRAFRGEL